MRGSASRSSGGSSTGGEGGGGRRSVGREVGVGGLLATAVSPASFRRSVSSSLSLSSSYSGSSTPGATTVSEFLFLLYLKKIQSLLSTPEVRFPRDTTAIVALLLEEKKMVPFLYSEWTPSLVFPGKESLLLLCYAHLARSVVVVLFFGSCFWVCVGCVKSGCCWV